MKKGCWLAVLSLGILMISGLAMAGELHVGIATEPWDLDPAIRTDTGSGYIITNVYDPLIALDQNNEPTAEFTLCTGWELKNNAQTIVLFLREGVKFHDGTALDAAAVVDTFERMRDPDHRFSFPDGKWANWKGLFGFVARVEVGAHPMAVVFRCREPAPPFFVKQLAMFTCS